MITLEIFRNYDSNTQYKIYNIQIYNKVNIILGKSGEGKTLLCNIIDRIQRRDKLYTYKCTDTFGNNKSIRLITNVDDCNQLDTFKNDIIIIDEDVTKVLKDLGELNKLIKHQAYFLILDRGTSISLDININAALIFKSKIVNSIRTFKAEPIMRLERSDIAYRYTFLKKRGIIVNG